jgi:hypothetical protein
MNTDRDKDKRRSQPIPIRGVLASGLLATLGLVGCSTPTTELRSAVELLGSEQGEVAARAQERIERYGRSALPYLEAALHRAAPPGRRNVVLTLRRLALPETAALLGHLAAFDSEPIVRSEAYHTLEDWAAQRWPEAGYALRLVDEARSEP